MQNSIVRTWPSETIAQLPTRFEDASSSDVLHVRLEGEAVLDELLDSWRTYTLMLAKLKLGRLDGADLDVRNQLSVHMNVLHCFTEEWNLAMTWALDLPGDDLRVGLPGDEERVEGGE